MHGNELLDRQRHVRVGGSVLAALNGNAVCDANPSCSDTRMQFQKLMAARDDGRLDQINTLAGQLQGFGDKQTLNATVKELNDALSQFSSAVRTMGLDKPGGLQAGPDQGQAGRQPLGRREPAGGRRRGRFGRPSQADG